MAENEEIINAYMCNLLWLIDLANDRRTHSSMRKPIYEAFEFASLNKLKLFTSEAKSIEEEFDYLCSKLGGMRGLTECRKYECDCVLECNRI